MNQSSHLLRGYSGFLNLDTRRTPTSFGVFEMML